MNLSSAMNFTASLRMECYIFVPLTLVLVNSSLTDTLQRLVNYLYTYEIGRRRTPVAVGHLFGRFAGGHEDGCLPAGGHVS